MGCDPKKLALGAKVDNLLDLLEEAASYEQDMLVALDDYSFKMDCTYKLTAFEKKCKERGATVEYLPNEKVRDFVQKKLEAMLAGKEV